MDTTRSIKKADHVLPGLGGVGLSEYYVYLMTNAARTLYVGVTNGLERRVYQHKNSLIEGFTSRYKLTRLAYFESTGEVESAILREKQIKGWVRKKKIYLVEASNPSWDDLALEWYERASN